MHVGDDDEATRVRKAGLTLASRDGAPTRVYAPRPASGAETKISSTRSHVPDGGSVRPLPPRTLATRAGKTLGLVAAVVTALAAAVSVAALRPASRHEVRSPGSVASMAGATAPVPPRVEEPGPAVPAAAPEPLGAAANAVSSPTEAARLLSVGAYAPALDAYRALSRAEPEVPVFSLITEVLERRAGALCRRDPQEGGTTCENAAGRLPTP